MPQHTVYSESYREQLQSFAKHLGCKQNVDCINIYCVSASTQASEDCMVRFKR